MKNMRIIFMGSPLFSSKVLKSLIDNGFNIVLCVSQPDKPVGRKKLLKSCPTKLLAESYNIDTFTPLSIKDDFKTILDYNPDLIITCAYGQFLPKDLLDAPKYKSINVHGSLLPKYRGASPVQRAIMNGDSITGISLMYMNEFMDEGDILMQKSIDIDIKDTNTSLFDKLACLSSEMLLEFLPKLFNGDISPLKQDNASSSIAKIIKKDDEYIDFNRNVIDVYNHIRALLDEPGCYFIFGNIKYKMHKVFFREDSDAKASFIYGLNGDHFDIGAINGYIEIYEIQRESKNKMTAKDFNNGSGKVLVGKSLS